MVRSGIAVGLNKGHVTTQRTLKAKPSTKKGVSISINDRWMNKWYKCLLFLWVLCVLSVVV